MKYCPRREAEPGDVFYLGADNKILYLGNLPYSADAQEYVFIYNYTHRSIEKHLKSDFTGKQFYIIGHVYDEDLIQCMSHLSRLIEYGSIFNL